MKTELINTIKNLDQKVKETDLIFNNLYNDIDIGSRCMIKRYMETINKSVSKIETVLKLLA